MKNYFKNLKERKNKFTNLMNKFNEEKENKSKKILELKKKWKLWNWNKSINKKFNSEIEILLNLNENFKVEIDELIIFVITY